jgi:hypothetical protein
MMSGIEKGIYNIYLAGRLFNLYWIPYPRMGSQADLVASPWTSLAVSMTKAK